MNFYYSLSKLKQNFLLKSFDVLYRHNKINPPSFVVWDSTKKCNLNCIHCGSGEVSQKELDTEEAEAFIDQLSLFGVKHFQITGGEPLLREDFTEIVNYASRKGLNISFASNGYYIDKEKVKSLCKLNVSVIQISIDGTKETHNIIRGNPESFDRAINALKLLKDYSNSKIGVSTVVMPQNIETLVRLRDKLISLNVDFWNIGTVMPAGKAENNPSLILSKEQFGYFEV
ncbi:radical SAM protein, partial [Chloroflexota bacterium]